MVRFAVKSLPALATILLVACGADIQVPTPIAEEDAISQGYLVVAPAQASAFADLQLVRYAGGDSACIRLSTYLVNSDGERVARVDEYPGCGLEAPYDSGKPINTEWNDTIGYYCELRADLQSLDLLNGDEYQTCFRWSQAGTEFVVYASLSARETLNLVNALVVRAAP